MHLFEIEKGSFKKYILKYCLYDIVHFVNVSG